MTDLTVEQSEIERKVFEICDRLSANGEKISNRIILSLLDGVTSTSTVHVPFKKWRELRKANKQKFMENLKFSDSLASAIADEIAKHSASSEKLAREEAQAANEQTQEAIDDLKALELRLSNESLLLEQANKDNRSIQKKADEDKRAMETLVQELRHQLEKQTDENKKLVSANESLRTELAKAELKLEGNESYVSEIKSQNQTLMADAKQLNSEISRLNKTLASQDATISGNEKLIQSLQSQCEKHDIQSSSLVNENTTLSTDLKTARTDMQSLNLKVNEIMEKLSEEVSKNTQLKGYFEEQLRAYQQTEKSNAATIAGNEKLVSQLEKMLAKSENEIKNLREKIDKKPISKKGD